jgi:7-carboxy-7-deazaguanine synthase
VCSSDLVLFSPVFGQLSPGLLAQWVLEDRVTVRVQVQLHKIIWGEERGR